MRRIAISASSAAALVVLALATVMSATCGEADSAMPDPQPCPPAPTLVPQRFDRLGPYRQAIGRGVAQVDRLTQEFRLQYPDGKFYRSSSFRADFAAYADTTVCIAQGLKALELPPELAGTQAAFDRELDSLIAHQAAGREAVRTRNVSEYRAWYANIDAKVASLRRASTFAP